MLLSGLLVTSLLLFAVASAFALQARRLARSQGRSLARLQRLLTATSDMIAIVGTDGYRNASAATLAITGYRPEELERVPLGRLVHPDDAPLAAALVERVKGGLGEARWEGRLVRKDGNSVWVETALSYDDQEQVVYLICRDIRERKQAQLALQHSERRLRSLVELHPDAVTVLDRAGTVVDVSALAASATGYRADELRGQSCLLLIDPEDLGTAAEALAQTLAGVPSECELRVVDKAGRRLDALITTIPIVVDGQVEGLYAIAKDITAKKRAEAALRESETRYRTLAEAASDAIMTTAADGSILFANPAAEAMFGYSAHELVGAPAALLLPADLAEGLPQRLQSHVHTRGVQTVEALGMHRSGREIALEVTFSESRLNDQPIFISYARDISRRKQEEARLAYLAYHDQLTGLPNRAQLLGRLAELTRRPGHTCALLYLDLDRFQRINDSLGRQGGDDLVVAVAQRLQGITPPSATVARIAGDEFAILLPDAGVDEAIAVAERMPAGMKAPFVLRGRELTVTTSIGIVPVDGAVSGEEVMHNARIVLRTAKRTGKRYEVFDPVMEDVDLDRIETEAALRRALERQEFSLVYQPVVSLQSGEIEGVEALVRWQRPGHGNVPPLSFIDVAEESGLILPLGRWILATSCRQMRQWHQQFGRPLQLSVNLSARQLLEPGLAEQVGAILADTGLDPSTLVLEITESILVPNAPSVLQTLTDLRERGVRVAIDDFGTGYSALSYIKRLPVDVLKVDQSFVAGLGTGQTDDAIVQALVSFAGAVNLSTVGEGVETEEQRELLRSLGCRYAQGYLFARPLPPAELEEYVERGSSMLGQ